jgi:zinc transport system substrate-binding protein
MIVMNARLIPALLSAVALAGVTACGNQGGADTSAQGDLEVVAAFYPLQYAVEQIGGDRVSVTGLTKPGVEPHDLELTPKAVATVSDADSVVYLKGFQPAVDDAVADQAKDKGFDVTSSARLDLQAQPHGHEGESEAEHDAHAEEEEHAEEEHAEGSVDPHFWLDPERYADVSEAIAARLGELDPEHADEFRSRADDFTARLTTLDSEFKAGLKSCDSRELVTSHAAFGYLADAYDLHQEGISGLSPEAEPDPATLGRIASFVKDEGVRTIYAETLVSKAVAQTLARETGATLAVLDPIEGLTDASAGKDYFEVMRSNLETLRDGQGCR